MNVAEGPSSIRAYPNRLVRDVFIRHGCGWGGQDQIRSSDSPIHVGPNDDRPSSAQRNAGRRLLDVVHDGDDNSDNDNDDDDDDDQCAKG